VPHDDLPRVLDPDVPDSELSPGEVSRRGFLRSAGLLGAGAASATVLRGTPAMAHADRVLWLAGDHHIHTQYSNDAVYRVADHARHARAYGLDWMVITDHGNATHAKIGVAKVNPDIVAAREEIEGTLIFQGLEWNIPAAEHGTVFVHPSRNEVAVLQEFENAFDGSVKSASASTPANEALALAGIQFLGDAVDRRRIPDALFLANHPARRGLDSPHEIRAWRDADPRIAVGFEGAPGHQALGIPAPQGAGSGRGAYDFAPSADSFQGYPLESYRTFGGFDWMTATVGGLWDSLLAEGKPWWITANSDSHWVYGDTADRGPGSDFAANGRYNDPVYARPVTLTNGDFWPGFYSRTHVGATSFGYAAVMAGLRAGRVWVDHGGLISGLKATVNGVTLGGAAIVRGRATLDIAIDLANTANWAQFVPTLARVDVIAGDVTGAPSNKDAFTTPNTRVVKSFEVNRSTGRVSFRYDLGEVTKPFYVRLRGTDGHRSAPGLVGAAVDPAGPAIDEVGNADPWTDLWFYSNPIWVLPHR
jgi:hypothetical protein